MRLLRVSGGGSSAVHGAVQCVSAGKEDSASRCEVGEVTVGTLALPSIEGTRKTPRKSSVRIDDACFGGAAKVNDLLINVARERGTRLTRSINECSKSLWNHCDLTSVAELRHRREGREKKTKGIARAACAFVSHAHGVC